MPQIILSLVCICQVYDANAAKDMWPVRDKHISAGLDHRLRKHRQEIRRQFVSARMFVRVHGHDGAVRCWARPDAGTASAEAANKIRTTCDRFIRASGVVLIRGLL